MTTILGKQQFWNHIDNEQKRISVGQAKKLRTLMAQNRALVLTSVGISIALLILSWWVSPESRSPWWSNVLTCIGVTLLLAIPVTVIANAMDSRITDVDTKTARAQSTANHAAEAAAEANRSLQQIEDALVEKQLLKHEDHLDVYRRLIDSPSRETLVAALRRAIDEGFASDKFLLSEVWETPLYCRFSADFEHDVLHVDLVTLDGTLHAGHHWAPGEDTESFLERLLDSMLETGHGLGVGLDLPTLPLKRLADTLLTAANLTAQKLNFVGAELHKVIMMNRTYTDIDEKILDGVWFFTETALVPADHVYPIPYKDLLEGPDLEEHIQRTRGHWLGIDKALDQARMLARLLNEKPYPSAESIDSSPTSGHC